MGLEFTQMDGTAYLDLEDNDLSMEEDDRIVDPDDEPNNTPVAEAAEYEVNNGTRGDELDHPVEQLCDNDKYTDALGNLGDENTTDQDIPEDTDNVDVDPDE